MNRPGLPADFCPPPLAPVQPAENPVPVSTVQQIREAEEVLLAQQSSSDELMRDAAAALAEVVRAYIAHHDLPREDLDIIVLAGPGGNGGDGLYAGSYLADDYRVRAVASGESLLSTARDAFLNAGGCIQSVDEFLGTPVASDTTVVIDAMTGIGGRPGLRASAATLIRHCAGATTIAVDIPSGIAADTGQTGSEHVKADLTVTFGGYRYAHVVSPWCGQVIVCDIGLKDPNLPSLKELLTSEGAEAREAGDPDPDNAPESLCAHRVVLEDAVPPTAVQGRLGVWSLGLPDDFPELLPGPDDDKYSGGVVGILAGSQHYPGAGVLCTAGAVRATSSMVRYIGEAGPHIVSEYPSVVWHPSLTEAGRVQALVVGPGRGKNAHEIAEALAQEVPVVLDADALTVVSEHTDLHIMLKRRSHLTVLTPHAGECARLEKALGLHAEDTKGEDSAGASTAGGPSDDRALPIRRARRLAKKLECWVLFKGRCTVLSDGSHTDVIDTGSSDAATPGSGDVLAGIIGAYLAWEVAHTPQAATKTSSMARRAVRSAIATHALASRYAAQTPQGSAPTSAERIAETIPTATAGLLVM